MYDSSSLALSPGHDNQPTELVIAQSRKEGSLVIYTAITYTNTLYENLKRVHVKTNNLKVKLNSIKMFVYAN